MLEEKYIYATPLGHLLLKTDADFLLEASFINEDKNPAVNTLVPHSTVLLNTIGCLNKYFSGEDLKFDIAVKQAGTEFQQQVWNALLKIKPGFTESYLELSNRIGNPKAIRAVGAANGKNNIALIIPCHRVIGSNGKLVGYAAGLWRKNWLLQHEAMYSGRIDLLF